jgi:integrase
MSAFSEMLAEKVENYIELRRSLGYAFKKQAGTLRAFARFVEMEQLDGPLTKAIALNFVLSFDGAANGRAIRHGVLCRFYEYLAVFEARTEVLDPRSLPRNRAIPPPRILSDAELASLIAACRELGSRNPSRGHTLTMLVGLLASTGLRSGEALRLDRSDVDLGGGVLLIRKTKFRKDRLVPVHATTLTALHEYSHRRDAIFSAPTDSAFFLSSRGNRLSKSELLVGFRAACKLAGLDNGKRLRPHDLRHRFAVTRLAVWHQEHADVQVLLPLLATYLGHARYSDTAYYVTATADLLDMAAERAFADGGAA